MKSIWNYFFKLPTEAELAQRHLDRTALQLLDARARLEVDKAEVDALVARKDRLTKLLQAGAAQ